MLRSTTSQLRLEKLKALGFESEAEYQAHHRVMEAARKMTAAQRVRAVAAGAMAYSRTSSNKEQAHA